MGLLQVFFSNRAINRWNRLDQRAVNTRTSALSSVCKWKERNKDGPLHGLIRRAL